MGFQQAPQNGANNDQWDGYAAERKELLEFVLANNIKNLLPLTGDIHNFFIGTPRRTGATRARRPAASSSAARPPPSGCRRRRASPRA